MANSLLFCNHFKKFPLSSSSLLLCVPQLIGVCINEGEDSPCRRQENWPWTPSNCASGSSEGEYRKTIMCVCVYYFHISGQSGNAKLKTLFKKKYGLNYSNICIFVLNLLHSWCSGININSVNCWECRYGYVSWAKTSVQDLYITE